MMDLKSKIAKHEADLFKNREDREAWLVFGDLLQVAGDKRGYLIALEEAVQRADGIDREVVSRHYESLHKECVEDMLFEGAGHLKPKMAFGYLKSIEVSTVKDVEMVAARPCSRWLEEIRCKVREVKESSIEEERIEFLEGFISATRELTVRSLNLRGNYIGFGGAVALTSGARQLFRLESLNLHNNYLENDGVAQIAWCPYMRNLERLNIGRNGVGDGGIETIAESMNLVGLRELKLRNNEISDGGAEALAQSENMRRVEFLDVGMNDLTMEGVEAIVESDTIGADVDDTRISIDLKVGKTKIPVNRMRRSKLLEVVRTLSGGGELSLSGRSRDGQDVEMTFSM